MKYMGVNYSHTAICWYADSIDRHLVYHAHIKGTQLVNFQDFRRSNKLSYVVDLNISSENQKKVLQFCIDNLNKPYGFWTLIGHLTRKILPIGKDGSDSFTCSEIVAMALSGKAEDFTTPKELYDLVKEL